MCGIVGFVGRERETGDILNILKKLEYRGYDSFGLTYIKNKKIITYKQVGSINYDNKFLEKTTIAIAHTRWATHGKPSILNAHPQVSKNKTWSVVHNGIIENYKEIKEKLKFTPKSDTDTSIIPQLLEENNVENIEDFIKSINTLTGSYSIVAITKHKSNSLFLAKKTSPLYVAKDFDNNFLVASDPICFKDFSKSYFSLDDEEFALIENNTIMFFNKNGEEIEKNSTLLDENFEESDIKSYPHFMLKEIFEEKLALKRQVKCYKESKVLSKFSKDFILNFNSIYLIGCGSAYHASLMGAKYLEKIAGIECKTEIASEFIYNTPHFFDKKTLFIFVSQSGETLDTLKALEIAKHHFCTTIALTNVLYSSISRKADYILPVCAGPEIAVASTKAYICQLSSLYMLAYQIKNEKENLSHNFYKDIDDIAEHIFDFDTQTLDNIAKKIKDKTECIFIGKDLDYVSSMESALKVKEVSYINATSYPSGELKHGFLALVEKGTPLFSFATNRKINLKTFTSGSEAVSRGAYEIVITNDLEIKRQLEKDPKRKIPIIFINLQNYLLAPIIENTIAQYLAYKLSILKGYNPDKPRNLAKSVTVE